MPIIIGLIFGFAIFCIVKAMKTTQKKSEDGKSKNPVVAVIIFLVLIFGIWQGCSACFGSSPSNNKKEPWRELGVSEKEYWENYNRIKYGK